MVAGSIALETSVTTTFGPRFVALLAGVTEVICGGVVSAVAAVVNCPLKSWLRAS
jgi:hypothetical protein